MTHGQKVIAFFVDSKTETVNSYQVCQECGEETMQVTRIGKFIEWVCSNGHKNKESYEKR